ncbi:hypothetical protein CWI83_04080 [Pseudidiomarina taiwanensis]|uniref:Bacteriophage CI repressor n=2 Tax=Pseudidiomarina taiwanensis TaxID=337250 RepID=A0A432ZLU2_9GAMM|nr:hypothetical protein CWI83_04080 [Pseudidiomarina taiwanensis]
MPNDTTENRPQRSFKSKQELMSVDECIEKLRYLSGCQSDSAVARWFGWKDNTLANWRRRASISYDTLVLGLLNRSVSVDWFLLPYQPLTYPSLSEYQQLQDSQRGYGHADKVAETLQALERVQPLFNEFNLAATEQNKALLVETLLLHQHDVIPVSLVLRQVARALASAQAQS